MNYTNIFDRLIALLGRSENDPEVVAVLTELGEKLPLKRPPSYINYNLLENKSRGFDLNFEYASSVPLIGTQSIFKEKEMVFQSIQDIVKNTNTKDVVFPFGIHWNATLEDLIEILGKYIQYDKKWNRCIWIKDDLSVLLELDSADNLNRITYRLITEYDLDILKRKGML